MHALQIIAAFIVGLFIGVNLGVVVVALLKATAKAEKTWTK